MTYPQATYISLRKYRAALAAGERGDWERADELTQTRDDIFRCAFCVAQKELKLWSDGYYCAQCPVFGLCTRAPQLCAWSVLHERFPAAQALTLYRVVIRRLEKLQAKYRAEK